MWVERVVVFLGVGGDKGLKGRRVGEGGEEGDEGWKVAKEGEDAFVIREWFVGLAED